MKRSLWTWSGIYYGERNGNSLLTRDGLETGRFQGHEIYGPDGKYLGELKNGLLVRKLSKTAMQGSEFNPRHHARPMVYSNHFSNPMHSGYVDFPTPVKPRNNGLLRRLLSLQ